MGRGNKIVGISIEGGFAVGGVSPLVGGGGMPLVGGGGRGIGGIVGMVKSGIAICYNSIVIPIIMKHILFTLKNCPQELLDDEAFVRETIKDACDWCKATLLNLASYKFEPQGVTCVAMLSESHISIHTWPEIGQAVCDVFTCGDVAMPKAAMEYMEQKFQALTKTSLEVERPLDDCVKLCYNK